MNIAAKGIPVSGWSWWIGSAEAVEVEGMYDLYECARRGDAIDWAESHIEAGDRFYLIEARCRALQDDDEFQPFAQTRNRAVFTIDVTGTAIEDQSA